MMQFQASIPFRVPARSVRCEASYCLDAVTFVRLGTHLPGTAAS